jgi:hypothetical protein
MMLPSVLALGAHLLMPVSDQPPALNVEQVCEGIAVQGGSSFRDPAIGKEKQDCIQTEQEVRGQLAKRWSSFSASDKTHCVAESEMGGDSSYTELLTCLEMAADVRKLGSEQEPAAPAAKPRPKR